MYLGEIRAWNTIEGCTHIERRGTDLLVFGPGPWQGRNVPIGPDGQCCNRHLQLAIIVLDLGLLEVVEVQRVGQGEDVFITVIPDQACLDQLNR
jgi:hypothetical protein